MGELRSILLTSMRSPFLDSDRVYPPLGILYLKAYLNEHGFEVGLEDEFDYDHPEKYAHYDAFGASVMTPQREEALKFLHFCKEHFPDKPVIIGGPHAKHYLDETTKEVWDYIVPWDGQRSLLKIMQGKGQRIETDFIDKATWANIARPDRTSPEAISMLGKYNYVLGGRRSTTLFCATGCPEKCHFCEDAQTAVRWSGIENLEMQLDEIAALGYSGVYIFDDLFAIALPKVKPIAAALKKRGLIYRCNAQARYFTMWGEEFARLLAETGCFEIAFGAESGSQKILDNIEKRTRIEQNYQTVEFAKKHGIVVKAFLMLGLPGETLETIKETEKFIQVAKPDDFQLSIYYPYKGTKLRDMIDRGEDDFDLTFEGEGLGAYGQKGGSTEAVVRTGALSAQELLEHRDRIVREYKPESHTNKWATKQETDHFFDTHLKSKVEYDKQRPTA